MEKKIKELLLGGSSHLSRKLGGWEGEAAFMYL
jgi:hypothetical protein